MGHSIPTFPHFTGVNESMLSDMQAMTAQHQPYSDFNVVNVLSWDIDATARISNLHGNLVMCLPDYITGEDFYSFLGDQAVEQTAATLLDTAESETGQRHLRLVPAIGAETLAACRAYQVTEDESGHDYVLHLPEVVAMHGKHFAHLRRYVHKFERLYGTSAEFVEIDPTQTRTQQEISEVFTVREQGKTHNEADNELAAISRLFGHSQHFDLQSFGVRIDGRLEGFIICELLADGWAVGHFWKANTAYNGIYRYLMHQAAQALEQIDFHYLNIEQDLGIPGMRHMKHLLAPSLRLKKYTVTDQAADLSS